MPANAKRPNLVLIMTDEMRGDCLGAAGHPDVKTPFLDTLAAQGIRFSRAYSTCPSCIAARAALHTGLSQEHHGRVGYRDGVPWDYPVTMAGELAKAGYATACAGKMHVYPLRRSMGFHHIDLHDGYLHAHRKPNIPHHEHQMVADDYLYWLKNEKGIACDITDTGLECNSWVTRPWMYDEHLHPTNWATGRALDFLRRRDRDQPFFLMLSYVRPHAPYDPPACYYDMYKNKALAPPFSGDWDDLERLRREGRVFCNTTGPLDPELIRQQQAGYYACITHVDHQIGRFLQGLMDEELYDNTVVVFTSDHGELLSDHGLCRKSRPYEGSAHIPLRLWGPEAVIGPGGRVSDRLAELRDIMPTLLDAAGVPIPSSLDGESLLQPGKGRAFLHGEHTAGPDSTHWIVTARDKYIWFSQTGKEQYFDLQADPQERHNAVDDIPCRERVEKLRARLIEALTGREEGFTDGRRLIPGRPTVEVLGQRL